MIILSETTDNLQVVLGGTVTTNQLECMSSWRDVTTTDYTPGRTLVATNNTTDVNLVGSPAGSTQRVIDFVNVYNKDTVAAVVTIKFDANGTEKMLWKGSLSAGEGLQYVEGVGWQKLSTGGAVQIAAGGPVDIQKRTTNGTANWDKPTSFTPKTVRVVLFGAGGGGGAGGNLATATIV